MDFLSEFLKSFLEEYNERDSKIILIKLLVLVAESSEQKLHFAQENGFKKLLHLLVNKNEKSAKAVSAAMLHFLTVSSYQNPEPSQVSSQGDERISISLKIRRIVEDLRNLTFSELKRSVVDENPIVEEPNDSQKVQQITCPSSDDYFQCDLFTLMLLDSHFTNFGSQTSLSSHSQVSNIQNSSPNEEINDFSEEKKSSDTQGNRPSPSSSKSLNDGVYTLITALQSSEPSTQIELLKTLPAILTQEDNKSAFISQNGSKILYELASNLHFQPESSPIFLSCLEEIAVDKIRVKDPFFFEFIFSLTEIDFLKEAVLLKIEDILNRDWRNVITALRLKFPLFLSKR